MPQHTPREAVVDAAKQAVASQADVIVTIGGGSLTDAAKAVQIAIAHGVTDTDSLGALKIDEQGKSRVSPDLYVRYIAIPTTLSGGEFSSFAGVTDSQLNVKQLFTHPQAAPQVTAPQVSCHSGTYSPGHRVASHTQCSSYSVPLSHQPTRSHSVTITVRHSHCQPLPVTLGASHIHTDNTHSTRLLNPWLPACRWSF